MHRKSESFLDLFKQEEIVYLTSDSSNVLKGFIISTGMFLLYSHTAARKISLLKLNLKNDLCNVTARS